MRRLATPLLILPFCALPLAVRADPAPTVEQLQEELRELAKRYESQNRLIHALEARLKQMEAAVQGPAAPAKPVKVAASTDAQATPSQPSTPSAKAPATPDPREETMRDAPPSRSAEAVYQEQHALFDRRFTLETGLTYSRFDRKQLNLSGFLALDAIFLGSIHVDTVKADIWTLDVTGRYSLSDRLQVDLNAPFLYRSTTYQSGGAGQSAAALSEHDVTMHPKLGDVNAGVYYEVFKETADTPDVVWNVRLKAPTGSNPYGIKVVQPDPNNNNLVTPTELPSGNGVWAMSTGLSFIKTADPAILFANVSYFHNFSRHFGDISTAEGTTTPGDIKLGDSFQYGLGTAFALNERMSLSLSYSQRFTRRSRTRPDGSDWTDVVGSDANAAALNFGATYALSDHQSIVTNIGAGLTPDAPNATVGIKYVGSY